MKQTTIKKIHRLANFDFKELLDVEDPEEITDIDNLDEGTLQAVDEIVSNENEESFDEGRKIYARRWNFLTLKYNNEKEEE